MDPLVIGCNYRIVGMCCLGEVSIELWPFSLIFLASEEFLSTRITICRITKFDDDRQSNMDVWYYFSFEKKLDVIFL